MKPTAHNSPHPYHALLLATADAIQHCPEHGVAVLSCRHEVIWPDGTTIGLHPVQQHDQPSLLFRAVHHAGQWVLFDLAHVIPRDVLDVKQGQARDQVGLVMYALLRRFHTRDAFLACVDRHTMAKWPGEGREPTARPPANKAAALATTGHVARRSRAVEGQHAKA